MTKMKDPKDILREMKASTSGVSPKDVTFSNFRDKKRKNKKIKKVVESENNGDIIENDEGFSLTNVEVETVSYADIGKKRRLKKKNSLEEWGAFDFFLFAQKKYSQRYSRDWGLNIGGSSLEINKIRDKFYDLFGFCCNLIMRDYINFFFNNYIDNMIQFSGQFYFSQMKQDKIMCEFCNSYNFSQSFLQYSEGEKIENNDSISSKEIKEAYNIGDTSLVGNYGIVISLNWLVKVKKMKIDDAARLVLDACREMASKDMMGVVISSTESYSPYPSYLSFKNPQAVVNRIDKNIKLNVEFNDESKYKFLQ